MIHNLINFCFCLSTSVLCACVRACFNVPTCVYTSLHSVYFVSQLNLLCYKLDYILNRCSVISLARSNDFENSWSGINDKCEKNLTLRFMAFLQSVNSTRLQNGMNRLVCYIGVPFVSCCSRRIFVIQVSYFKYVSIFSRQDVGCEWPSFLD